MPGRPEKWRLGDVLIQQRLISQEQLQQTLDLQRTTGKKVGRLLIETGVTTEELLANGLARQLRIPFVNLKTFPSVRKSSNCCPRASDNQRYCPVSAKCRAGRLGAGLSECRVASGTGMGASCTPETPAGQASRHVGGAHHIALQLGPAEQRWHLGRRYLWRPWVKPQALPRWQKKPGLWAQSAKMCRLTCARWGSRLRTK